MLTWLDNTNKSLDEAVPVYGDPRQIETELSKLKVKTLLFVGSNAFVSSIFSVFVLCHLSAVSLHLQIQKLWVCRLAAYCRLD